ncbi:MAG: peptidase M14 [Planctomycetes bacterium]|nr:peptidase M14 [Planctomycetota bacterium]
MFIRYLSQITIIVLSICAINSTCAAQQQIPSKTDITWNRFYNYDEISELLHKLVDAYPQLLSLQSLGKSEQGREMWLVTLNVAKTGADTEKPAMYIDGNVHGNEIQSAETVVYSIWYLTKSYGKVDSLTELMDRVAFYFLPMQNPDGRDYWFNEPNNPHSSRTGQRPTDNDFDGLVDEDGPEDLDGDGHIGTMWRFDPNGTSRRNRDDPRIIERVEPGQKGELSRAGSEGIDNDGDGRINEDGPGGYDMNRNWPSGWQPNYIQYGAGDYPFDRPETNAIGQFITAHPNIAAGQSYHNAGGMMLRGPGAKHRENLYPRSDKAVYSKLGKAGEEMLPFYRYLVIYADLYTVHGGFVTWLSEGLGIVSFTNELWSNSQMLQNSQKRLDQKGRLRWQDRMLFGQTLTEYTEYDHPTLGKVLIGGGTKYSSRIPPPFMLEELCHRNFAFTMFHADNMPLLSFQWIEVKSLGNDLWQITIEVANEKIIPSRLAIAAQRKIGQPDRLSITGKGIKVVTSGKLSDRFDKTIDPVDDRKHVIPNDGGIPGQKHKTFRYLVTGKAGAEIKLQYTAEKSRDIEISIKLESGAVTESSKDE